MRSFARNAPQKRERLLLADRVRSAVRLTEAEARLTGTQVQVELVSPEAWVEGDPVQLEQVFVNLLLNAIEACEGSGRPPAILIRTGREEGGVAVEVVDNGPGIQIEGRDLFDALVTTKSNGLGMGLAIARDIVEAHTGSITSLPTSDGAILRVWLPECHDC